MNKYKPIANNYYTALHFHPAVFKDFTNTNKRILRYLQAREILSSLRKLRHKDDDWLAQDQAVWKR